MAQESLPAAPIGNYTCLLTNKASPFVCHGCSAVHASPPRQLVFAASTAGIIEVWDMRSGDLLRLVVLSVLWSGEMSIYD